MDSSTTTAGDRLLDYAHSRLVAVFDSHADIQATVDALTSAGFDKSLDVHCGVADSRLIDFSGTEHGPLARLGHALHLLTVEGEYMQQYEHELLSGHCLVMVRTESAERRHRALEILKAHGGHFINQSDSGRSRRSIVNTVSTRIGGPFV
jgi:hypothetical protein